MIDRQMSFAVRFTKAYIDASGVVEKIAAVAQKCVVYQHDDASRIHCHMLVEQFDKTEDTLRRWIRSMFENPARTDISIKSTYRDASGAEVPIDSAFIVYMSKGRLDPSYVKGYSETDISEHRSRWVNHPTRQGLRTKNGKIVVDGVGDDPSQPSTQRGQKTKWQLLAEMQEEWGASCAPGFDDLFRITRKVLKKNKQAIGFYKVMDYMEGFLFIHQKDTAYMMIKQMWDRKFSRL